MATRKEDRSLLLAVLALQNRFVTQDQLIELLNHWSQHREQTIEQLLQQRLALTADDIGLLKQLVARQLSCQNDISASLSQHTATFDLLDTRDQLRDAEVRAALESAAALRDNTFSLRNSKVAEPPGEPAGTVAAPSRSARPSSSASSRSSRGGMSVLDASLREQDAQPGAASRFAVVRNHARGGLGEVFVARDRELDREVALKEIQTRFADDPTARQRFELEACITGGLEHPGVVPVYGYGHYADGRPYYAMRFIRGVSMKDEIAAYHQSLQDPTRQRESHLALRQLLRRFIDTCNAIGYAHSRGVLHRDIKPANVMLGKFGETLVVDWGLAKSVGRDGNYQDTGEDTLLPLSGSMGSATMLGSALGTPSYMSPEQALGQFDRLGPASDIFSLGATLFTILVGHPPYEGKNPRDVLELAKQVRFSRPRELQSHVPRALEAICLEAMRPAIADRYATTLDLARDVENFLADDRVMAYRESWVERSGRWLRRHRTFTAALAALILTTAVAALVTAVFVDAARQQTLIALADLATEQQRTRAAWDAEQSARKQTREALNTITDDLVGEMLSRQMQLTDSDRKFLQRVLEQFQKFTDVSSGSREAQYVQADGFLRVGNLQRRLGEWEPARHSYDQALQIWNALLTSEKPDSLQTLSLHQDLAAAESNRALLAAEQGDDPAALAGYQAAAQRLESAVTLLDRMEIGEAVVAMSPVSTTHESSPTGISPAKRIALQDKLYLELGRVQNNLGNTATRLQQWQAASGHFSAALDSFARVSEPARTVLDRGRTLGNQAGLWARLPDRSADVEPAYRRVLDLLNEIPTDSGLAVTARWERAAYARSLADWLFKNQQATAAVALVAEAVRVQGDLTEEFPLRAAWRQELARSLQVWAAATRTLEPEAARDRLQRAIEIRRDLAEMSSDSRRREELLAAEINFANWLRVAGEHAAAIAAYLPLRERTDDVPGNGDRLRRAVLFGLGDCYVKTRQYQPALECWTLLCANLRDPDWERFEMQRAICLVRTGQYDEGLAAAAAVARDTSLPVLLYDTACCHAVMLEEAGDQLAIERRRELETAAIGFLQQAADRGFFADAAMRRHAATDIDLKSLRNLPEFVEFAGKVGINETP